MFAPQVWPDWQEQGAEVFGSAYPGQPALLVDPVDVEVLLLVVVVLVFCVVPVVPVVPVLELVLFVAVVPVEPLVG